MGKLKEKSKGNFHCLYAYAAKNKLLPVVLLTTPHKFRSKRFTDISAGPLKR